MKGSKKVLFTVRACQTESTFVVANFKYSVLQNIFLISVKSAWWKNVGYAVNLRENSITDIAIKIHGRLENQCDAWYVNYFFVHSP